MSHCDECSDCDLVDNEASVAMTFVNADSLSKLNLIIENLTSYRTDLDNQIDSIDNQLRGLSDSLSAIQFGLDTGNQDLEDLKVEVISLMSDDSLARFDLAELFTGTDSIFDLRVDTRNRILSGFVLVSNITNLTAGKSISYEDSSNIYWVPLNFNDTISRYEIFIQDSTYNITFVHQNNLELDGSRNVLIEIENFKVHQHQFDSISPSTCLTNDCSINETTLTCYF